MTLTPAQLDTLCARSAAGEGVTHVLAEWGCNDLETITWLRDNHHSALKAAKQEQKRIAALESADPALPEKA